MRKSVLSLLAASVLLVSGCSSSLWPWSPPAKSGPAQALTDSQINTALLVAGDMPNGWKLDLQAETVDDSDNSGESNVYFTATDPACAEAVLFLNEDTESTEGSGESNSDTTLGSGSVDFIHEEAGATFSETILSETGGGEESLDPNENPFKHCSSVDLVGDGEVISFTLEAMQFDGVGDSNDGYRMVTSYMGMTMEAQVLYIAVGDNLIVLETFSADRELEPNFLKLVASTAVQKVKDTATLAS